MVHAGERLASLVGGGSLLVAGLLHRSKWSKVPLAAAGLALTLHGLSGRTSLTKWLGIDRDGSHHRGSGRKSQRGFHFQASQTIQRTPEDLYRAWRDFEGLPGFLTHLVSVTDDGEGRSHWVAKALVGKVEWDAEIINERAGELIAWQSLPDSQLDTAGSIHFQEQFPKERGTIVRVSLKYDPPAGKIGATIASLFGSGFEQSVREDLRRFKQIMEAGEAPSTAGQPRGACSSRRKGGCP